MKRIVCFHSLYSDVDFGVTAHLALLLGRRARLLPLLLQGQRRLGVGGRRGRGLGLGSLVGE